MQPFVDGLLDIVLSPALWLCVLFGLIYAVLFTLWRGGGMGQALRDALLAVFGFGIGQGLAMVLRLSILRVGDVHLLFGSLFAVLALLLGRRFWRPRPRIA